MTTTAHIADTYTGRTVEWDTWSGTATVYVESVSLSGITVRSRDGYRELHPTSFCTSLDDIVRRWRIIDAPASAPTAELTLF